MTVSQEITQHILECSGLSDVDPNENLFESQILSSLDVLDLICFLEVTFGLDMMSDNVSMEDFNSINSLVSLIERKTRK